MQILIVNQSEVKQLLPMAECIEVMAEALKTVARGQAILPLRPVMWLPEKVGALGMMPAYMGDLQVMGLKVVSVFPGNHGTEYDSHMGAVMIFETKHGQPLAIMDATEITAIRTAAVSGVATKLLARESAGDLAILGSGTQARTHLEAMLLCRKIHRVRVWSRNPENGRKFVERESRRHNIQVDFMPTVQAASREQISSARPHPPLIRFSLVNIFHPAPTSMPSGRACLLPVSWIRRPSSNRGSLWTDGSPL